jgi:hypothetical protein
MTPPIEKIRKSDQSLDWGRNQPQAPDRARHVMNVKHPFEWWYFDGQLDNGQFFVGAFLDPSFVTEKPQAVFSLYDPDWKKETHLVDLERKDMNSSTSDIYLETPVGFIHRSGNDAYQVQWDIGGIQAYFTMTTLVPGWIPKNPDGSLVSEGCDFFWTVHQARNRIEGTITRGGISTKVSGIGYADHNWGIRPLNEIAEKWIWGRIVDERYTVIFADVDYINPSCRSTPLYIARGDKILVGTGSPEIRQKDFAVHPTLKRFYPRLVSIRYDHQGVKIDITIHYKGLAEEVDLLTVSNYHPFVQWIARTFFARPTYFRVLAEYNGTITASGIDDRISGQCIYELMGFK